MAPNGKDEKEREKGNGLTQAPSSPRRPRGGGCVGHAARCWACEWGRCRPLRRRMATVTFVGFGSGRFSLVSVRGSWSSLEVGAGDDAALPEIRFQLQGLQGHWRTPRSCRVGCKACRPITTGAPELNLVGRGKGAQLLQWSCSASSESWLHSTSNWIESMDFLNLSTLNTTLPIALPTTQTQHGPPRNQPRRLVHRSRRLSATQKASSQTRQLLQERAMVCLTLIQN